MKHYLLFVLLVLSSMFSYTQKKAEPILLSNDTIKLQSGSYEFKSTIPQQNSAQKNISDTTSIKIVKKQKVTLLYELNDLIYFQYWHFEDPELKVKLNANKIFSLPKTDFEKLTIPLYSRYKGANVGTYTIPFRLRGIGSSEFDFESTLSLQTNVVFGFGTRYKKESWFDASMGIGLSGININSKNSKATDERTASAFTISIGGLVRPSKFANLGIFMGWDFLAQNDREVDWIYNGKPWLGIGINVSFSEIKTENAAKGYKQEN